MVKDRFENGLTIKETSEKYNYSKTGIKYLCRLYREYGAEAFNKKITTYNRETKLYIIKRVFKDNESVRSIAIEYELKDPTIIRDWIVKYKKGGELAIQDAHSRHNYKLHNDKILEKEHKKLLEDLKRTKAENEYLKKIIFLNSKKKRERQEYKIEVIQELRKKYSLKSLLEISKSSFFYGLAHLHQKSDKDKILEEKIVEIFNKHYEKYGRPRVTTELHRQGIKVKSQDKTERIPFLSWFNW